MALTQLAKQDWHAFFDAASKALGEKRVTVELTGLELGDRLAADHAVMSGMSYEERSDVITLFIQGLEHRIQRPKNIHVDRQGTELTSFEVIDADGVHHIVRFDTAVALARS